MFCEICNKNPAKIHITQVKDNQKHTIHICHSCAHEKGLAGPGINTTMSVEQLLSGFEQSQEEMAAAAGTHQTCPSCGLSYGAFKESGRLGCAMCYDTFSEHLQPLLQKVQKDVKHVGKAPHSGDSRLVKRQSITDLRNQLKEAVSHENFELAAKLRDQIYEMEKDLESGSDE